IDISLCSKHRQDQRFDGCGGRVRRGEVDVLGPALEGGQVLPQTSAGLGVVDRGYELFEQRGPVSPGLCHAADLVRGKSCGAKYIASACCAIAPRWETNA